LICVDTGISRLENELNLGEVKEMRPKACSYSTFVFSKIFIFLTYFVPLEKNWTRKKIDVIVLVLKAGRNEMQPEVYITAYPIPFEAKELVLFD